MSNKTRLLVGSDCQVHICPQPSGGKGREFCRTHGLYVFQCKQCCSWYHSTRPHVKTCSNACRTAKYRSLKKGVIETCLELPF